jgi:hypothetical protein
MVEEFDVFDSVDSIKQKNKEEEPYEFALSSQ